MVRQARQRLPQQPEDRPRPRHRRQRRDDGLRQHGRRLRHRRRLHARPQHRRARSCTASTSPTPRARTWSRASARRPRSARWSQDMPAVYAEFQRIGQQLERHYRDVQDLEFTIERGRLYMLQTRSAKRTAAAAVKIAVDMVAGGPHHQGGGGRADRAGAGRPAAPRDQFDPAALKGADASPRASTPRRAPPSGGPCSTPMTRSAWVERGEKVILVRIETSPGRLPRHGRGPGHHHRPRRRDLPCRGRRAPDRQALRRRLRRARSSTTRTKQRPVLRDRGRVQRGRLGQPRRLDRRALPRRAARPSPRGSRTSPTSSRCSAGPTRSAAWGSGPTPTSRRRPRRPAATAPRASACAAPSTCSARASGWRSCAARSSSPTTRPAPRRSVAAGEALGAEEQRGRRRRFDAAMAQARGPPAGRLRGHLQGDGRAARWSSGSSTRRSTSSCPTSRSSWSR